MRLTMYLSAACALGLAALPSMAENQAPTGKDNTPAQTSQPVVLSAEGLPAEWLQGTPVQKWEPGKIYLLEFWATWCGPCLAQIPHLNQLHKDFPDSDRFQIVGINVFDKTTPKALKKFLENRSPAPTYTIGADTKEQTAKLWLKPLNVNGIPFSAIVKDGNILWQGHPDQLSKELIQNLIDGKPIPASAPSESAADKEIFNRTAQEIFKLYSEGDYRNGEKKLTEALAKKEFSNENKQQLLRIPFRPLLAAKQYDLLRENLDRLPKEFPQEDYVLMNYAHTIITTYEIPTEKKNLKGAEEALLKVIEIRKGKAKKKYSSSMEWSRIAEARMLAGDREGAIKAQEEAVRQLPLYQYRNTLSK